MTSSPNDAAPAAAPNEARAGAPGELPNDPPAPAPAIVLGHGEFAAGLIAAAAAITGRGELLVPVSNDDAGVDEIERRVAEAADRHGARVIFTDLPAGSCAFAARRLLRIRPGMIVVTGTSLAALVDYVFHAEQPAETAAEHAAEVARKSVTVLRAPAAAGATASPAGGGQRAG